MEVATMRLRPLRPVSTAAEGEWDGSPNTLFRLADQLLHSICFHDT